MFTLYVDVLFCKATPQIRIQQPLHIHYCEDKDVAYRVATNYMCLHTWQQINLHKLTISHLHNPHTYTYTSLKMSWTPPSLLGWEQTTMNSLQILSQDPPYPHEECFGGKKTCKGALDHGLPTYNKNITPLSNLLASSPPF